MRSFIEKYRNKKVLISISVIEVLSLILFIISFVITFDYIFGLALNSFTNSWIGDVAENEPTSLVSIFLVVGNISYYLFRRVILNAF